MSNRNLIEQIIENCETQKQLLIKLSNSAQELGILEKKLWGPDLMAISSRETVVFCQNKYLGISEKLKTVKSLFAGERESNGKPTVTSTHP